jgi:hypothetical protein
MSENNIDVLMISFVSILSDVPFKYGEENWSSDSGEI